MIVPKRKKTQPGQILVSVIIFMALGLTVIAMSAALTVINLQNTMKYSESAKALSYAEAGAEEGILRLIRDPTYSGGTLPLDAISVTISVVTNGTNKDVTSTAIYNGFTKKILARISLVGDKATLLSWDETN
jgi:hypothetical protein